MTNLIKKFISPKQSHDFKELFTIIALRDTELLLRNDILLEFQSYCDDKAKSKIFRDDSSIIKFIKNIQECFVRDEHLVFMHRYAIAKFKFYLLRKDGDYLEEIFVKQYLDLKDQFVLGHHDEKHLHINFMPFYENAPRLRDTKTIGNGIRYLNGYLCSNIFQKPNEWHAKLFEFIKLHTYDNQQLLVNGDLIADFDTFYQLLEEMVDWLNKKKPDTPFANLQTRMKKRGFEAGWGDSAKRISDNMQALLDMIAEPSVNMLEDLIARIPIPLISRVAIVSPHGWFGQEKVLGKPDTGGQVIYILDQVRALEQRMQKTIRRAGLDVKPKIIVLTRLIPNAGNTSCNKKLEKIFQTDNAWILRIPFRDENYKTMPDWISRFKIWPYLERFAEDAGTELLSQFQERPDLVIGNYSDGNLVATLLSDRFDVIQCTIAHALEKTKYQFSDINWSKMEDDYHFSLQFTADIISMNKSDFIITSTRQEILGTDSSMGQYESYQYFSLPGLYQIEGGIDLMSPKFNVIPPGVEEDIYYPYDQSKDRIKAVTNKWKKRLFTQTSSSIYGYLNATNKIPIFTMARLDKIKNITGLVEAFGSSEALRKSCNLIIAAGTIHFEQSKDVEEQAEIKKLYSLIKQYDLNGSIRWLPSINKLETGEVYRIIADNHGIFVQPALFEAFGLTIIEAMASGLPTFATEFGGPLEIIENGKSGYLINTSSPDLIAKTLETYFSQYQTDNTIWNDLSKNGVLRVQEHFNWSKYSERLLSLTKLYGFWRYAFSAKDKTKMSHYCDVIYHFLIKEKSKYIK